MATEHFIGSYFKPQPRSGCQKQKLAGLTRPPRPLNIIYLVKEGVGHKAATV
jgi:hypothetical protein